MLEQLEQPPPNMSTHSMLGNEVPGGDLRSPSEPYYRICFSRL